MANSERSDLSESSSRSDREEHADGRLRRSVLRSQRAAWSIVPFDPGTQLAYLRASRFQLLAYVAGDGRAFAGGEQVLDHRDEGVCRPAAQYRHMGYLVEREAIGGEVTLVLQQHVVQLRVGGQRLAFAAKAGSREGGEWLVIYRSRTPWLLGGRHMD